VLLDRPVARTPDEEGGVDDLNVPRHGEPWQMLVAPCEERRRVERRRVLEREEQLHLIFSAQRIADGGRGAICDPGRVPDCGLQLEGRDVLPPPAQDVSHPAHEPEKAVGAEVPKIAGTEPEIAARLHGGLVASPVALQHHVGAARAIRDLPGRAGWEVLTPGPEDHDVESAARPARAAPPPALGRPERYPVCLRLAVDLVDRNAQPKWDAPDAFVRGRLDLVTVAGPRATILDWKSGWLSEDEEGLRVAWAPGLYAALLWAWAPRLEAVSVEYHYLRTGRVARVALTRADATETLAWARALASTIAAALASPEDPRAFPPRPSTACGTCPWVNRCPAGHAALEAMAEGPIPDDAEAGRLAGLLLAGEARVGRLRERLKQYLGDRAPLTLDDLEVGFFPTSGRYDASVVARVVVETGADPWPLLSVDSRALRALFRRHPSLEVALTSARTPTPPWFGHRRSKTEGATRKVDPTSGGSEIAPGRASHVAHESGTP
jgi:PD-(D/E)XK nuclease superfamily